MRQAFILGRKHGETKFDIFAGPEMPFHETLQAFRGYIGHGTDPVYAELRLYTAEPERVIKMEAAATKESEKIRMKKSVVSTIAAGLLLALSAFTAAAQARYDSSYVLASGDATDLLENMQRRLSSIQEAQASQMDAMDR